MNEWSALVNNAIPQSNSEKDSSRHSSTETLGMNMEETERDLSFDVFQGVVR